MERIRTGLDNWRLLLAVLGLASTRRCFGPSLWWKKSFWRRQLDIRHHMFVAAVRHEISHCRVNHPPMHPGPRNGNNYLQTFFFLTYFSSIRIFINIQKM